MAVMSSLPYSRPLTAADLEAMPDDGHRYELVDGTLIVTPAPSLLHQRAVGELYLLLRAGCPDDLEVILAPFDVRLGETTVLQPDLLVARRRDVTDRNLPAPPVLTVEVLSPSTRLVDLNLKLARFQAAGTASYWTVDPGDSPLQASISAWDLHGETYGDPRAAYGEQHLLLERPFPLDVVPARLVV